MLDWAQLHPVERLELLTTHDLARQEKQKLELLRGLLTYYHYASTESRQEVLQVEINRINAAANEQRDRYRSQYTVQQEAPEPSTPPADPVAVDEPPPQQQRYDGPSQQRYEGLPPSYDEPPPAYDEEPPYDDDDAQTRVISNSGPRIINGRHRRGMA